MEDPIPTIPETTEAIHPSLTTISAREDNVIASPPIINKTRVITIPSLKKMEIFHNPIPVQNTNQM